MNAKAMNAEIKEFCTNIFKQWDDYWLLLTSGNFQTGRYNAMTVAWGGFGIMWNLPIAMVVVRPSRYTYGFINDFDTFTLCGFPKEYRKALSLLGSRSGRDGDKIAASGLTPIENPVVPAPLFEEATLRISCRKIYYSDFIPEHFIDDRIENLYHGTDYHRMFYGEILNIQTK